MNKKEIDWKEMIAEQLASGETIEEFCASRGLNKYTFRSQKYRAARNGRAGGADFFEIRSDGVALRIKLRNGREVEVGTGFNEKELRRLVGVLESC